MTFSVSVAEIIVRLRKRARRRPHSRRASENLHIVELLVDYQNLLTGESLRRIAAEGGEPKPEVPSGEWSLERQMLHQCALLLSDLVIAGAFTKGSEKWLRVIGLYTQVFSYLMKE